MLHDQNSNGVVVVGDAQQCYTRENSLFACRSASIWTVNCPCPMGARRCRDQACHFARTPLSAECRADFEFHWALFNHPHTVLGGDGGGGTLSTRKTKTYGKNQTQIDALLALEEQDASLSLTLCRYAAQCRSQHCHRLHTLDQILAVFARPELLALYREARINISTTGDDAAPTTWQLCAPEKFYCHRTPQCALHSSYEYRLRLTQETSAALRYPVCRVFCNHCRATRFVPIYE